MINAKLQNIIDTKSAIGNAINNKGGSITSETPFYEYAPAIENISTGGGAYSTFVAQAQDNSLYTVYNGYDSITNPTPNLSNNFAFNRWLLNNSATGDVVLSNVVVAAGGNFNGTNFSFNEASMPFVNNTANYGGIIYTTHTNNGFLYVGGDGLSGVNRGVSKFNESTLVLVGNTANYHNIGTSVAGRIRSVTTNNGFLYAGGESIRYLIKYDESNLSRIGQTPSYGGDIYSVKVNNNFIYLAGDTTFNSNIFHIKQYHESNLALSQNGVNYGANIKSIAINNGFIYAGGVQLDGVNRGVAKYHESNLALVGNTVNYGYGAIIETIAINNGFIYAGGRGQEQVYKYGEDNLTFIGNTASYGATINSISIVDGFIYVGGTSTVQQVKKYHESNLVFVGNTVNVGGTIEAITTNNGFIYASGDANRTVKKFEQKQTVAEQIPFYNITNIKE
jgi:hypothetical protein